jgi:tetratricopeptide (TPR) repeat protein
MKLQIRYKENVHSAVNGACIRGSDPMLWLKEIDSWDIPAGDMEYYLLPSSIQSIKASGIFILFKNPVKIKQVKFRDPYTCIENSLFIPCNAEIIPEMSRIELKNMLLWDRQVFHPVIGLVGYEPKDAVNLADLFFYDPPLETDWSFAHPGMLSKPTFSEIIIVPPTAEELINDIKEEIGQKPLEDIPKKKEEARSVVEKILDKIKFGLLKAANAVLGSAAKVMPEGNAGSGSPGREGLLQKFQNWVIKNLDDLQKKRNDELRRLLNLFDEDTDEALQYAIPLNSPYLNRGTGTASTRLTRNPLRFNPGRLGGGQAVDAWNVGDYYHDLREKYLRAAQKEIEQKDFKKAAYVYAHLLGDYHSAANTLQQGKMYREAAALYKDHLKNIVAAAECLEKGGLYLEAIELNKELNKDEKVGDLYRQVDQGKNAEVYYEKHIEAKLSHNDHLDAARVIDEKLEQKERAQQVLLSGWGHSYQHESCLKKYFDIVLDTEPATAEAKLKNVFAKSTPRHKRMPLLNVLEHIKKKSDDPVLEETTRAIVYEIVHKEAESGNAHIVYNLKIFFPEDKLVNSDASRYVSGNHAKPVRSTTPASFQLDQSIKWLKAVWHRNQFLTLGIKNSCLHMARGNWYGNLEYFAWTNPVKSQARFAFINAPYYNNYILLNSSMGMPVTRKNLPKNKYFNEALVVYCPVWLHKGAAQVVVIGENTICRLDMEDSSMTLHHYAADGELKKSVNCSFENEIPSLGLNYSNSQLASHEGYYYTCRENYFFVISEKGRARAFGFNSMIRFFSASQSFAEFRIIVSTNNGCLLYRPSGGDLNMQGGFFAEQMSPSSISFVQSDKFVIVEKTKASLFGIKDDVPYRIKEYDTHTSIIAALPTSVRNQFALVEESGKINICEMEA